MKILFPFQVWFSNRRARLRKQLASNSGSYTPMGVGLGMSSYTTPTSTYPPLGQSMPESTFSNATGAQSKQNAQQIQIDKTITTTTFSSDRNVHHPFPHPFYLPESITPPPQPVPVPDERRTRNYPSARKQLPDTVSDFQPHVSTSEQLCAYHRIAWRPGARLRQPTTHPQQHGDDPGAQQR